jgi:hypothetical protein
MAVDMIGPVLAEYVANAVATLTPAPGRVITYQPGEQVAWDECCDGQLWGRVVLIQPGPIQPKGNGLPCGIPWFNVVLGLGIIRCVASVSDKGKVPSASAITDDGAQMLLDLATLQEVMLCTGYTTNVLAWTPLGPEGGCAGGEWTFTIRVMACGCPNPYPPAEAEPEP